MLQKDIDLNFSYTFDIDNVSISPDPQTKDDTEFIWLVSLKSACVLDQNLLRARAMTAGIRARLGPSQLETIRHIEGFKVLIEQGPCKALEQAILQVRMHSTSKFKAVVSAFRSNNDSIDSINYQGNRTRSVFY